VKKEEEMEARKVVALVVAVIFLCFSTVTPTGFARADEWEEDYVDEIGEGNPITAEGDVNQLNDQADFQAEQDGDEAEEEEEEGDDSDDGDDPNAAALQAAYDEAVKDYEAEKAELEDLKSKKEQLEQETEKKWLAFETANKAYSAVYKKAHPEAKKIHDEILADYWYAFWEAFEERDNARKEVEEAKKNGSEEEVSEAEEKLEDAEKNFELVHNEKEDAFREADREYERKMDELVGDEKEASNEAYLAWKETWRQLNLAAGDIHEQKTEIERADKLINFLAAALSDLEQGVSDDDEQDTAADDWIDEDLDISGE